MKIAPSSKAGKSNYHFQAALLASPEANAK
jgi:hypothetical protein